MTMSAMARAGFFVCYCIARYCVSSWFVMTLHIIRIYKKNSPAAVGTQISRDIAVGIAQRCGVTEESRGVLVLELRGFVLVGCL